MVINPNKPVLFPVYHSIEDLYAHARELKDAFRGKKKLFIELSEYDLTTLQHPQTNKYSSSNMNSYLVLAEVAQSQGITVVPLDSEKMREEQIQFHKDMVAKRIPKSFWEAEANYLNYHKRENLWIKRIRGAKCDSLVIMAPSHAVRIAQELKIPQSNILIPLDFAVRDTTSVRMAEWFVKKLAQEKIEKIKAKRVLRERKRVFIVGKGAHTTQIRRRK
jgi:hypothetical protein